MRGESGAYLFWRVGPLHAGVEALGILAEDDHIDLRLLVPAARLFAYKVQRVARKADAGAQAYIQAKALAHGHDWAVVGVALAPQRGLELVIRLFLRLGSDGTKIGRASCRERV